MAVTTAHKQNGSLVIAKLPGSLASLRAHALFFWLAYRFDSYSWRFKPIQILRGKSLAKTRIDQTLEQPCYEEFFNGSRPPAEVREMEKYNRAKPRVHYGFQRMLCMEWSIFLQMPLTNKFCED